MHSPNIIGTLENECALWQANFIKDILEDVGHSCVLKILKDEDADANNVNYSRVLEAALLNDEIDIIVHSYKDIPLGAVPGSIVAAVTERDDPSELLLIRKDGYDAKRKFCLKKNARIGSVSPRRSSQLLAFRRDISIAKIEGDIAMRIKKLREGSCDALLIASALIDRLEIDVSDLHSEKLDPSEFIPAPAQGVLAIRVREKDATLRELLRKIDKRDTRQIAEMERRILAFFQKGCQAPVGVYALYDDEKEMFSVRAVKATSWNEMPVSVYSESKNPEQLTERIIQKINSIRACKVFITRAERKESYLKNVLTGNGFQLEEKALIETVPVRFGNLPDFDWIFFSSKHAVKYFFEQEPKISSKKYACVGKATADALRRYGQRADFIGSSTDTKMTGKQFASLAGSSKVLFPQAKGSMKSIQNQFVRSVILIDLVVYETLKRNEGEMPQADIVIFTSPSNVDAWFENFTFRKDQKAIAMGDATANALRKYNVFPSALPDNFDDTGMARAVFGVSSNT